MANGTLVISAVSGSGPYSVTVADAGSLANSDHFGAPTSSGDGVWVVSALSGNTFTATDSLDLDGGTYGAPTTGSGWFGTPTSEGVSPIPKGAANWRSADIRNARVASSSQVIPSVCDGRLSVSSSDPLGEASGAATIYYLPYVGRKVALYSGSVWEYYTLGASGVSLALSGGTASKPHDVFLYGNAGTLTLELVAWTDATNRATALATQDSVYVKSGATGRRYLGTIYLDGSKQCTFNSAIRGLWNESNRLEFSSSVVEGTNSWNYNTAAWRQANGSSANQVPVVIGRATERTTARVLAGGYSTGGANLVQAVGVGIDSTTTNSSTTYFGATVGTSVFTSMHAEYSGQLAEGYRVLAWLEYSHASGTATYIGDNGVSPEGQSGMTVSSYH